MTGIVKGLVVTVTGTDRRALVEALSKALAAHHGNWLESRIAGLGGCFVGILLASVPDAEAHALSVAMAAEHNDFFMEVLLSIRKDIHKLALGLKDRTFNAAFQPARLRRTGLPLSGWSARGR